MEQEHQKSRPPVFPTGVQIEPWMVDAADEIFFAVGVEPFDNAVPLMAATIAKHYQLRGTQHERAAKKIEELKAFIAEKKRQKRSGQ